MQMQSGACYGRGVLAGPGALLQYAQSNLHARHPCRRGSVHEKRLKGPDTMSSRKGVVQTGMAARVQRRGWRLCVGGGGASHLAGQGHQVPLQRRQDALLLPHQEAGGDACGEGRGGAGEGRNSGCGCVRRCSRRLQDARNSRCSDTPSPNPRHTQPRHEPHR